LRSKNFANQSFGSSSRQAAAGNRVVTSIEVLSPDNKEPGAGRISYLKKREEMPSAGVNPVEIDLLTC
jgi:hypothetical protein